jgi:hypothetical protein
LPRPLIEHWTRLQHGMPRPHLSVLPHDPNGGIRLVQVRPLPGKCSSYFFSLMSDHDRYCATGQSRRQFDDMDDHRPAGHGMKHLGLLGFHALSKSRCHDNDA